MTSYIVAQINIQDRERYGEYEAGFGDVFAKHSGKILSVEEQPQVLEGQWPHTRTVLIEFPTNDDALAWYNSDEYQAVAAHRFEASTADVALLAGVAE